VTSTSTRPSRRGPADTMLAGIPRRQALGIGAADAPGDCRGRCRREAALEAVGEAEWMPSRSVSPRWTVSRSRCRGGGCRARRMPRWCLGSRRRAGSERERRSNNLSDPDLVRNACLLTPPGGTCSQVGQITRHGGSPRWQHDASALGPRVQAELFVKVARCVSRRPRSHQGRRISRIEAGSVTGCRSNTGPHRLTRTSISRGQAGTGRGDLRERVSWGRVERNAKPGLSTRNLVAPRRTWSESTRTPFDEGSVGVSRDHARTTHPERSRRVQPRHRAIGVDHDVRWWLRCPRWRAPPTARPRPCPRAG